MPLKLLVLFLLVVATTSCFLFDQASEESLGQLHIDAALVTDTCGPGVVRAGVSWSYEVEIHRAGNSLRWLGPEGAVTGTFTKDDEFCIELFNQWPVRDPDPWLEDPGCEMHQIERLCATVTFAADDDNESTSEEVETLTGRHETYISGVAGSICTDLIGIGEGQYLTLPCQVAYELMGTATSE